MASRCRSADSDRRKAEGRDELAGATTARVPRVATILRDAYDVPVSLAKRLLTCDHTIHLSPAHARAYSHAMHMSRLKGPCCCPCLRWYAFRGLSKHLIAALGWRLARVATLTELLEGCGGPSDNA